MEAPITIIGAGLGGLTGIVDEVGERALADLDRGFEAAK